MGFVRGVGILKSWKFLVLLSVPLILIPIFSLEQGNEHKCGCGYVILLMGVFWSTGAVPLPVTAFLPLVLFPLLGVQDTASVSRNYMKEGNMMLVSGLIVALAVQYSNLHRRLALFILTKIGTTPARLMLGTMSMTGLLSMWITNSGATALMLPVPLALLQLITESRDEEPKLPKPDEDDGAKGAVGVTLEAMKEVKGQDQLRTGLLLGIMAAANICGLMWPYTAHSSVPLYLFHSSNYRVVVDGGRLTAGSWMLFNLPPLILNFLIAWTYLWWMFGGTRELIGNCAKSRSLLEGKWLQLGGWSFHEVAVALLILLQGALSLTRDPKLIPGWTHLLTAGNSDPTGSPRGRQVQIGDSSATMFLVFLLFLIPKDFSFLARGKGNVESLLDWKFVQAHLPWGVVLLMGGGYAISDGCQVSGLSAWIGEQLDYVKDWPQALSLALALLATSALAQLFSATATANALIPIITQFCQRAGMDGLYLSLPLTMATSTAAIFPVATPPNAIVFGSGLVRVEDMIKSGIFLTISSLILFFAFNLSYGYLIFHYQHNQTHLLPILSNTTYLTN